MKRQHLPDAIAVDSLTVTDGDTITDVVARDAECCALDADHRHIDHIQKSREAVSRDLGEEFVVDLPHHA